MSARRTRRPTRSPLRLLNLEDRTLPSTFTVLNTLNNSSPGSLIWAVGQANSSPGADTIDFDGDVFSTPQTITLGGAQLELSDTTGPTSIKGPAAGVTVSGHGVSRVILVDEFATASISGMTITSGHAIYGGGLFNSGTVTLTNCTVSGNTAYGNDTHIASGGGLFNSGTATLTNCTVSGNSAKADGHPNAFGGGLNNSGSLTLTNCTVTSNFADGFSYSSFPSSAYGGGLYNGGTATLTDCTVSGNSAKANVLRYPAAVGGGVNNSGSLTLTNCTVTSNFATGFSYSLSYSSAYGGGLYNSGTATLTDCAVSGNSATSNDTNQSVGGGGGLLNVGTVSLTHCTVTGNFATGHYSNYGTSAYGGGLYNSGTATLTDCTVSGNSATGSSFASGGGVANGGTATLTRCTVSDNSATASSFIYFSSASGGGLYNFGTATLTDCTVSRNSATGHSYYYAGGLISSSGFGGGVANGGTANGGTATLTRCTVSGNSAVNGGGVSTRGYAYYSSNYPGTTNLTDCTVSGTSATGNGGGLDNDSLSTTTLTGSNVSNNSADAGGGIANEGTLAVVSSTINNNQATSKGGGISTAGASATGSGTSLTMTDSTVSGNTAPRGSGGGLYLFDSTTVIRNSTIAYNAATAGGGIYCGGLPTIDSTIVAKNIGGTSPDLYGQATATFSLIGNTSGMTLDAGSANNLLNRDPLLAPLADNGGPTRTHALLPGSPAISAGSNPANLTTDQRGAGFPRVYESAADIGAFEVQQPTVPSVVVNAGQPNLVQRSMVTSLTVTFSGRVTFTGPAVAAFQLARTGPGGTLGNVTLAVDLSGSTATQTIARLTFSGPLTEGANSLVDGNYTLTILSSQVKGGLLGGDTASSLFRLFGDVNGDRTVNGLDFAALRNAFGASAADANYRSDLDFNDDGAVNALDLNAFRARLGVTLP